MGIKIHGIDKLLNKLNKLSHIETEKAINEVAEELERKYRVKQKLFQIQVICMLEKEKLGNMG